MTNFHNEIWIAGDKYYQEWRKEKEHPFNIRYIHESKVAELEELNKDLHKLVEQFQDGEEVQKQRVAELEADIREMVNKAADKNLQGYRDLGKRCSDLEEDRDKWKARANRWCLTAAVKQKQLRGNNKP